MKKFLKIFGILILIVLIALSAYLVKVISNVYGNAIPIVDKPLPSSTPTQSASTSTTPMPTTLPIIDEDLEFEIIPIYKEEKKSDEIINIVLTGMDARNYEEKSRSDTIILASYNKTQKTVKLVSFMRDSYVNIPDKHWAKINSATAYGGIGLLINTLNENFDLDIQNYIEVKFDDFQEIIDILGGIDVELSEKEVQYINRQVDNDLEYSTEPIHLNGEQALWHCRNRSVGNSDFERTSRQREVLTIIINKALKMDLPTAMNILDSVLNHVKTNVPIDTIVNITKDVLIDQKLTIESSRIPYDGTYTGANINGSSVLQLDMDKNIEKLHEFLGY